MEKIRDKNIRNIWKDIKSKIASGIRTDFSAEEEWNHLEVGEIYLDFSRAYLKKDILDDLVKIAKVAEVEKWRDAMFCGEKINDSEKRAVLHTALRAKNGDKIKKFPKIFEEIKKTRQSMLQFVKKIKNGEITGIDGGTFSHIVNIGIGGSYLGSKVVSQAISDTKKTTKGGMEVVFLSNIDPSAVEDCLNTVPLEKTLFIVASKTFTTQETMTNAQVIKKHLVEKLGEKAVEKHFVALSTNLEAVKKFGISPEKTFGFWDFVGGRYSLWSAIGLPAALTIGVEKFEQLLEGAREIDDHFCNTPLEKNLPVLLALIHIYWNNALDFRSRIIVPYLERLSALPLYLQQLEMESNGKSIDKDGEKTQNHTSTHVWGETGTNAQHSFFQLLHQGTHKAPIDFISSAKTSAKDETLQKQHQLLLSNLFAQIQALHEGLSEQEVRASMQKESVSSEDIDKLAPQKTFFGKRPSLLMMVEKLDAKNLGKILAIYEHKVFVEGIVWNINSFDQWGVELGKKLTKNIQKTINDENAMENLPNYTKRLAKKFLR